MNKNYIPPSFLTKQIVPILLAQTGAQASTEISVSECTEDSFNPESGLQGSKLRPPQIFIQDPDIKQDFDNEDLTKFDAFYRLKSDDALISQSIPSTTGGGAIVDITVKRLAGGAVQLVGKISGQTFTVNSNNGADVKFVAGPQGTEVRLLGLVDKQTGKGNFNISQGQATGELYLRGDIKVIPNLIHNPTGKKIFLPEADECSGSF